MSKFILLYDQKHLMEFQDCIFAIQFMESLPRNDALVFLDFGECTHVVGLGPQGAMQLVEQYWKERDLSPILETLPAEKVHLGNTHRVLLTVHAPIFIGGSRDVPEPISASESGRE